MKNLTSLEQEAQQLGFPATLFGYTPNEANYWREPGLPWLTQEARQNPPAGYGPRPQLPHIAYVAGNSMAPRFPDGCAIALAAVVAKENLVVGRVYCYSYRHRESGEREMAIARLTAIGGNYLEVAADNPLTPTIWPLEDGATGLYEVTHYGSYPALL